MPLVVELSPEIEKSLRMKAEGSGHPAESVAARIIEDSLRAEQWDDNEDLEFLRRSIADGEAGRVRPAEEVMSRLKAGIRRQ